MCGLAGALASNPVDCVRTRMMNQKGVALYQGTLDCLVQVSHMPCQQNLVIPKPSPDSICFKCCHQKSDIYLTVEVTPNCFEIIRGVSKFDLDMQLSTAVHNDTCSFTS